MAYRISSVPRTTAPNAGYQPRFLSDYFGDTILVIPDVGLPIGVDPKAVYLWGNSICQKIDLPIKIIRILSLVHILLFSFIKRNEIFFVHSFIYCIPLFFSGAKFIFTSHGSDRKYFEKWWSKLILKRAEALLSVGPQGGGTKLYVRAIPNIFNIDIFEARAQGERDIDVVFVLRDALVKNPDYPHVFSKTSFGSKLKIAVVGLMCSERDGKLLSGDDKSVQFHGILSQKQTAAILQRSKVFICPSFKEGIPKAILEALACGCHIVISETLQLPPEFEEVVVRLDLNDLDAMQSSLSILLSSDPLLAHKHFVKSYNEQSKIELIQSYQHFYEVHELVKTR